MTTTDTQAQDQRDMERLAGGDDSALNDLMARHGERLYHYLLRVVQNDADAEDIAEEAFVRVYQHRAKFRLKSKFSTWLYTIATNLARDLQRRRARQPQVSLEAEEHHFSEVIPSAKAGPGEAIEAAELTRAVRQAIASLPEELRLPLVLAEYEEKSHGEIGAILGCSAKAVEMRIYRARQDLRRRLSSFVGK